jgi:hypothetical protein
MSHESGDSPDATAQSAQTAQELQGLRDVIALTLFQIDETPPEKSRMQTVYQNTDHAVMRQVWLLEKIDDAEAWLDETGELWYVGDGLPGFDKPLDLTLQDESALIGCKTIILSFMANLTS